MRRRGFRFAAWAALLLAAGCGRAASSPAVWPEPAPSSTQADERDAAVYRAVLADAPTRTVLRITGSPALFAEDLAERIRSHASDLPGLDPSTVQSFLDADRTQASLPDLGDSTLIWVSEAEWRTRRETGVAPPNARWRHGMMVLSRVGYSRDGAQALVYTARVCPLCGSGQYLLLARAGDRWTVTAESLDWVS